MSAKGKEKRSLIGLGSIYIPSYRRDR